MAESKSSKVNFWINIGTLITLIISILGYSYYEGQKDQKVEMRLWSTPEKRVKGEEHIDNAQSEKEFYDVLQKLDTVADLTIKDARENLDRDSIRDDQTKRNTVTIFQMKSTQDTILKKLDEFIQSNPPQ